MSIEDRVELLEVDMSGCVDDIIDLQIQLGAVPTSSQVADSLSPLREDVDNNVTRMDSLEAAIASLRGSVKDIAFNVRKFHPSGSF